MKDLITDIKLCVRHFEGISKKNGTPYDFFRYFICINGIYLEIFLEDATSKKIVNNYVVNNYVKEVY